MRIFKILFLSVCLMLLGNQQLKAQKNLLDVQDLSSVNIDAYKDEDLKVFLGKVNSLKISQQEVYNLLKAKGLPDAEAEKLIKKAESIIIVKPTEVKKKRVYSESEEDEDVIEEDENGNLVRSEENINLKEFKDCRLSILYNYSNDEYLQAYKQIENDNELGISINFIQDNLYGSFKESLLRTIDLKNQ